MTAPVVTTRTANPFGDAWTIARRDHLHWAAAPAPLIIGLLFPVLLLLMFGYLFGGGIAVPGGGDYRSYLVPGMFVITMVFGLEATMMAVTTDAARGVTDRFRSMPMARSAVVAGRSIADLTSAVLGLVVMIASGLLVGWRWTDGLADAALAVLLLVLLRFAVIWAGLYLGLVAKNPEAVVAVQVLVWPFGFLSNAFVPTDTMPGWLAAVAEWNPISATATATRELFGNPGVSDSWAGQHSLLLALLWPAVLVAVFAPLAVRRYQRLSS